MIVTHSRWAARRLGLAVVLAGLAGPALAQQTVPVAQVQPPSGGISLPQIPDSNGALIFHGNYCGPGSRGAGLPPVDALDAACMRHDACSPPVGTALPSCSCNARLAREASLVARAPRTPDDTRVAAMFITEGARALACR